MQQMLPARARVDIQPFELGDGLEGLLQAVFQCIQLRRDGDAPDVRLDELRLMSGAAFKHYVAQPWARPGDAAAADVVLDCSPVTEVVCNFGAFESLSYYLGWDFQEFSDLLRADAVKLLRFELAGGRAVVSLDGAMRPALVVGYEVDIDSHSQGGAASDITLDGWRAGGRGVERVRIATAVETEEAGPGEARGDWLDWMLIARPAQQPEWAASRVQQRRRVLAWAVEHAERPREFSQEYNRHFVVGLRAYDVLADALQRLVDASGASEAVTATWMRWSQIHVDGLIAGRAALVRELPLWGSDFGAALPAPSPDEEAVLVEAFEDCARRYDAVVQELRAWRRDDARGLTDALRGARVAEQQAVDSLRAALARLDRLA